MDRMLRHELCTLDDGTEPAVFLNFGSAKHDIQRPTNARREGCKRVKRCLNSYISSLTTTLLCTRNKFFLSASPDVDS